MRGISYLFGFLLFFVPTTVSAEPPVTDSYAQAVQKFEDRRQELARKSNGRPRVDVEADARAQLLESVETLSAHWLGTRWALGAPQTTKPQIGKVNCGTFVGRILNDSGFRVHVKKLQRQPSQLIIKSFVGSKNMRKFSRAPMKKFLASVREMGPGLFIIGLDFHVGLLLQTEDDLRFIHASFETETVVNESAAKANPIKSSQYRVVGKILTTGNIRSWLGAQKIAVKGDW